VRRKPRRPVAGQKLITNKAGSRLVIAKLGCGHYACRAARGDRAGLRPGVRLCCRVCRREGAAE